MRSVENYIELFKSYLKETEAFIETPDFIDFLSRKNIDIE